MNADIIESTVEVPLIVRIRDVILTVLIWALYLYFMRDFFAFIVDVIMWGYHGFDNTDNYPRFHILSTFISYFEAFDIVVVLFMIWSAYNMLRFGNKNRRRSASPVLPEDLAEVYGLQTQEVENWQHASVLVMHHDEDGNIAKVAIKATKTA